MSESVAALRVVPLSAGAVAGRRPLLIPALALDGRVLMSGSVPSVDQVRDLLTAEAP